MPSTVLYAVIARARQDQSADVLHAVQSGAPQSLIEVVKKLLASVDLRKNGRKSSIFENRYLLTHLIDGGFFFLVCCDGHADRDIAQSMQFLVEIRGQWVQQQAIKNDRNAKYREVDWDKLLNTKMAEWSHEEQKRTEKVKLLQDEVMDVKKIMLRNVEGLIQRQEAVDAVIDKTETLQTESVVVKSKSSSLKKQLWFNNIKLWICLGVCVCILVCLLLLLIIFLAR
jgi:vesicle-associated membrane protein 7